MATLEIASFIVGIGGLLVGIWGGYIGYKGRRTQIMEYCISSSKIITNRINNIPGLQIVVGGEFTSDLTLTEIEFINQGNSTINYSDFATLAPLQVISSGHFFNLETIKEDSISSDNPNLNPKIEIVDSKTLNLIFEYLKPKQSFSISILHDGEVTVEGDLKAGKLRQTNVEIVVPDPAKKTAKSFLPLITFLLSVVALLSTISGILIWTTPKTVKRSSLEDVILALQEENKSLTVDRDTLRSEYEEMQDILKSSFERLPKEEGGLPDTPDTTPNPHRSDSGE